MIIPQNQSPYKREIFFDVLMKKNGIETGYSARYDPACQIQSEQADKNPRLFFQICDSVATAGNGQQKDHQAVPNDLHDQTGQALNDNSSSRYTLEERMFECGGIALRQGAGLLCDVATDEGRLTRWADLNQDGELIFQDPAAVPQVAEIMRKIAESQPVTAIRNTETAAEKTKQPRKKIPSKTLNRMRNGDIRRDDARMNGKPPKRVR